MSYGDLQRWKDIFKEDCYQEWLTRASPSGLDENAVQHVVARNLKSVTDELALEKRKVSDLTDRFESLSAIVLGMEGRTVNSELTAKTAATGVSELKAATERSYGELRATLMTGQEETVKLRQDVSNYTMANDNKSNDLSPDYLLRWMR